MPSAERAERKPTGTPVIETAGPTTATTSRSGVGIRAALRAGNRATTNLVQRRGGRSRRRGSKTLPKGPDVRAALRGRYPALLQALDADQLDRWQHVVDWYWFGERIRALDSRYRRRAGPYFASHPDYRVERDELDELRGPKPSDKTVIPASALLSDDIWREPEWDVKAEMAFREWAVAQIEADTVELRMRPQTGRDPLNQYPLWGAAYNTKGFITPEDLKKRFKATYEQDVSLRTELKLLAEALETIKDVKRTVESMHETRSSANAERQLLGLVRHVSEALGTGHADYPSIKMWDRPQALIEAAGNAMQQRHYELAVMLIAQSEQDTAAASKRFMAYEERVMTGAGRAVKTLLVAKKIGTLAAGIASGGLGLTGSALVAGGYTFAQEGAQQLSEKHQGLRQEADVSSLFKQAGTSAVMTVIGGALQARFQAAIKLRIDQVPALAGTKLGDIAASTLAAGTSSVYTTATELAIQSVIEGKALPKNASQLADMIVDNALESMVLDVALRPANSQVAREYEAWRSQRRGGGGGEGVTMVADDAEMARTMPTEAVERLLTEAGGWERLQAELASGTGLGANMTAKERAAITARFEAHRQMLASDVATVFDGAIERVPSQEGVELRVRFSGEDAAVRAEQAAGYLDAKRAGWRKRSGVTLEVLPQGHTAPGDVSAMTALQDHLRPEARYLADRFARVYADWPSLSPAQRLQRMADVANRPLVAAGYPPLAIATDAGLGSSGVMDARRWRIAIKPEYVTKATITPAEFADIAGLTAHEARHGLQWVRAARTNPDKVPKNALRPDVMAIARGDPGTPKVESLTKDTMLHDEASRFFESVWGGGRDHRNSVLRGLRTKGKALTEAAGNYHDLAARKANGENVSPQDLKMARLHWEVTYQEFKPIDVAYRQLPEEVDAYRYGNAVGEQTARAVPKRLQAVIQQHQDARKVLNKALDQYRAAMEIKQWPEVSERDTAKRRRRATDTWTKVSTSMNRLNKLERQMQQLGLEIKK